MEMPHICDTGDVAASLMALRRLLSIELANVEKLTEEINNCADADALDEADMDISIEECQQARTGLLSALASVDELFGWVHLFAERDEETEEVEYMQPFSHLSKAVKN